MLVDESNLKLSGVWKILVKRRLKVYGLIRMGLFKRDYELCFWVLKIGLLR